MNVADLVRLIRQVPSAAETTELEWKLEWDLEARPRRAELARHSSDSRTAIPIQQPGFLGGTPSC